MLHVLGRLLGNGRGTQFALLWVLTVALGGVLNGFVVEAVMLQESGILTGHNGNGQRTG